MEGFPYPYSFSRLRERPRIRKNEHRGKQLHVKHRNFPDFSYGDGKDGTREEKFDQRLARSTEKDFLPVRCLSALLKNLVWWVEPVKLPRASSAHPRLKSGKFPQRAENEPSRPGRARPRVHLAQTAGIPTFYTPSGHGGG